MSCCWFLLLFSGLMVKGGTGEHVRVSKQDGPVALSDRWIKKQSRRAELVYRGEPVPVVLTDLWLLLRPRNHTGEWTSGCNLTGKNDSADSRAQTHSVVICVGKKELLGLCRRVNHHFIEHNMNVKHAATHLTHGLWGSEVLRMPLVY